MPSRRPRSALLLLLLLALPLLAVGAYFLFFTGETEIGADVPVWTLGRGPLRVTVLEGGSLEALESHTIVSGVEGRAAILDIVDEGTVISADDVEAALILIRLDSSGIEERLERQEIDLAAARASYENAASNLDIQRQQNASDIRKVELEVRFALLDLARYVGKDLVDCLIDAHRTCGPEGSTLEFPEGVTPEAVSETGVQRLILTLLANKGLEGEAQQTIRRLDSDIGLAEEEHKRAQVEYDWSGKLRAKGFVSIEEEEADRIALERRRIELERARIAREQFAKYDFPKEVESLLSNLVEAEDRLSRTLKRTASAEAKSLAEATSRREQLALQEARHEKLRDQLDACVIRADRPGLVVFATSGRRHRRDSGERIQVGATVQERQAIIKIPNLTKIGVKADIHESVVERVSVGQPVTVVVDALPDQPIPGSVTRVAPLPNAAESWLNPDRKVYATAIVLDEIPAALRPGMSAQVEILVADLPDVLLLPVQAVTGPADRPLVYVVPEQGDPVQRAVTLGLTDDRFVAVESGLEAGDTVLLAPPQPERLGRKDRNGKPDGRGPTGAPRGSRGKPAAQPTGRGSGSDTPKRAGRPGGAGRPATPRKPRD